MAPSERHRASAGRRRSHTPPQRSSAPAPSGPDARVTPRPGGTPPPAPDGRLPRGGPTPPLVVCAPPNAREAPLPPPPLRNAAVSAPASAPMPLRAAGAARATSGVYFGGPIALTRAAEAAAAD